MSGTNRNITAVKNAGNIVGMNAFHIEAQRAMMLRCIFMADNLDKGKFPHSIHQILHEKHLAFLKRSHTKSINIVKSLSSSVNTCRVLGSCFEFFRNGCPDRIGLRNAINHFAASKERRHAVEQFVSSPQNTDAKRAKYFMA